MADSKPQAQNEQESNAWIPTQEGQELTGTVVEIVRAWSDARTNGGKDMDRGWYPLIRLIDETGKERDWHAFGAVAENRVMDKQPMPGERITITYLGVSSKEPPKGMNAPKLFRLLVHDRDPQVEARNVYADLGAKVRDFTTPPTGDKLHVVGDDVA